MAQLVWPMHGRPLFGVGVLLLAADALFCKAASARNLIEQTASPSNDPGQPLGSSPKYLSLLYSQNQELALIVLGAFAVLLITCILVTVRNFQHALKLKRERRKHHQTKQSLERGRMRVKALMRNSARVSSPKSVEETLDAFAMEATNLLGVGGAGFRLLKGDKLVIASRHKLADEILLQDSIGATESLSGLAAATGKPVNVSNLSDESRYLLRHRRAAIEHKVSSYLAVPMIDNGDTVGVMIVCDKKQRSFSRAEVSLLGTFANQAAVAIAKTRLYEQASRHAEALRQQITERKQIEIEHEHIRRSNEQILNSSGDGIYGLDADGRTTFVNPAAARMIGWEANELIGKSQHDILHRRKPDGEPLLKGQCPLCKAVKEGTVLRVDDETLWRKDGSSFPVEYTSTPIRENDELVGTVVNFRDISQRQYAEKALQTSEQRYRILYDDNPSMYFTVEPDGEVLSVNPFGAKQLNYTSNELLRTSFFNLCHAEDVGKTKEIIRTAISNPNEVHRHEVRLIGKDGQEIWTRESARLTTGTNGQQVILIVCEDITEAYLLSEELQHQATHDFLTGLVNRREFERRLRNLVDGVHEEIADHVLFYLDLDHFKLINDLCGHNAGDHLLKQLGQILSKKLRRHDTLARLGGDEFGVLLEHCKVSDGERIAETLKDAVQEFQFIWQDKTMNVGVSIGIVAINHGVDRGEALLGLADAACYQAKQAGRNRIRLYDTTDTEELNRMSGDMKLRKALEHALEDDQFFLVYQPIVPIANDDTSGEHYELLLRLNDDKGKLIPTPEVIRVAEQYGFSTKIDIWVIRTMLEWLAIHPDHLKRLSFCFINLSGNSLGDDDFLKSVLDLFKSTGIPPNKVCFEVTETAAIANFANATHFIDVLTKFGCQFALDDFGSGLSSFAYMKNLAVDFIKIDGIFVKDLETDPISLAMVKSINEICHVTGKRTIAEFVENEATLDKLREIGVDYAQGYGICKPTPLTEMKEPGKWATRVAV